jgi:hypothetical protein
VIANPTEVPVKWDDSDADDEGNLQDLGVTYISPEKPKRKKK